MCGSSMVLLWATLSGVFMILFVLSVVGISIAAPERSLFNVIWTAPFALLSSGWKKHIWSTRAIGLVNPKLWVGMKKAGPLFFCVSTLVTSATAIAGGATVTSGPVIAIGSAAACPISRRSLLLGCAAVVVTGILGIWLLCCWPRIRLFGGVGLPLHTSGLWLFVCGGMRFGLFCSLAISGFTFTVQGRYLVTGLPLHGRFFMCLLCRGLPGILLPSKLGGNGNIPFPAGFLGFGGFRRYADGSFMLIYGDILWSRPYHYKLPLDLN